MRDLHECVMHRENKQSATVKFRSGDCMQLLIHVGIKINPFEKRGPEGFSIVDKIYFYFKVN